jgi:methyl-accepting chemotaxis protein
MLMSSLVDREPAARLTSPAPAGFGVSEFFRYHGLWAPGVRLFRNIGFRAKALLISLVFALPIVLLAWAYFGDKAAAIGFSAKERVGVAYVRDAMPLLRELQRERFFSLQAVATGNAPAELGEVRTAIEAHLKTLAATDAKLGAELGTTPALAVLREKGAALPAAAAGLDTVLAAHNARVQALLDLITVATDNSNLTLDPDLDTYYLMDAATGALPTLVEATAQLRGVATALAGGAQGSPAVARVLHAQEAVGDYVDARWAAGVAKVEGVHPGWKREVDFDAARAALHRFHEVVVSSESPARLRDAGNAAVEGLFKAQALSLARLDELLEARIAGLEQRRNAVAAVLLLAGLAVVYLFTSFRKVLEGGLREVEFHINAMRDGDLTTTPRAWGGDEAARLMTTLAAMQDALRRIVSQVRGASDSIVSASTQIASGANDLSSRTEQSAANLEETASAMEEIAATVKRGEDAVGEASRLAVANAEQAEQGGRIVGELVQTMQAINGSSVRIGDIIGTIDGIAFQTNILALNAAVEAARAGEQGRGFAVVASEVRALAQRSATAAREIKSLVGTSLGQTESGVQVVQKAGDQIQAIVASSRRVNELLAEVSVGAREQTAGVMQSARAVQELDSVTQQNAALVEQTAAAAGSLQDQAQGLAGEVSQFKLPAGA